tara:strand:+ start:448 stop:774 length:327 start_codon:yes stop_codon:yes gene_type:complete
MSKFFNVRGPSIVGGQKTHELVAPGEEISIKSILITNITSGDAQINVVIENDPDSSSRDTFYLLYGVTIPNNAASLLLNDPSMFKIPIDYGLYIQVASSDQLTVMIGT